jgi:hypothetical protein
MSKKPPTNLQKKSPNNLQTISRGVHLAAPISKTNSKPSPNKHRWRLFGDCVAIMPRKQEVPSGVEMPYITCDRRMAHQMVHARSVPPRVQMQRNRQFRKPQQSNRQKNIHIIPNSLQQNLPVQSPRGTNVQKITKSYSKTRQTISKPSSGVFASRHQTQKQLQKIAKQTPLEIAWRLRGDHAPQTGGATWCGNAVHNL